MNFSIASFSEKFGVCAFFLHEPPKVFRQWFSMHLYAAELLQRGNGYLLENLKVLFESFFELCPTLN